MLQDIIKRIVNEPDKTYNEMLENDPEFKKFVEENKEKTVKELMDKYHIII